MVKCDWAKSKCSWFYACRCLTIMMLYNRYLSTLCPHSLTLVPLPPCCSHARSFVLASAACSVLPWEIYKADFLTFLSIDSHSPSQGNYLFTIFIIAKLLYLSISLTLSFFFLSPKHFLTLASW